MKYAFIKDHEAEHAVRRMCAVLQVHHSGYYAWRAQPLSARAREDERLGAHIQQCWERSGRIYGYRKITHDLRDMGQPCGKHRVARLMRAMGLRSHTGYGRRPARALAWWLPMCWSASSAPMPPTRSG